MEFTEYIFALAVIIIGIVRWFIENRNNSDDGGRRDTTDSDLPDWTWPVETEEQAPPPPVPSSPPPPPPSYQKKTPQPPQRVEAPPLPTTSGQGSLSALQQKIAEAKKRAQEAEARRKKITTQTAGKQVKSATHTPHGVTWLLDPKEIRRAIIAREILGPPLALRDDPDSEIR